MQIGQKISYLSYGIEKSAKIIRFSPDGKIVYLDNKRWIHRDSVKES